MVERLQRLVITLLVLIATIERAFSRMKLFKTCLHTKLGDDVFRDYVQRSLVLKKNIESFDPPARKAKFKL
jgi:hypothetical protein